MSQDNPTNAEQPVKPAESESKEEQSSDDGKGKNSEKKARVFDLTEMLELSKKTIEERGLPKPEEVNDSPSTSSGFGTFSKPEKASSDNKQAESGVSSGMEDDEDDMMVMLPPGFKPDQSVFADSSKSAEDDDDSDFDEYEGDGIPTVALIPSSMEANLSHGSKPVSALRFEPAGVRFASGGLDYMAKVFDFQKMDMSMNCDKEVMPAESHIVNDVAFSGNGDTLAVATGGAQLRLLDRKGKQWTETVRGDQYLVDLSNTKGHTAAVNAVRFHPLVKGEFLSCSDDGTLRIWRLEDYKEITKCINKHFKVIKTKTANGKRAMPQTCCYSNDGKLIAAGCDDGSIQVWKHGNFYVNTSYLVRTAHRGPITCICFSPDSKLILSRGLDDSLKLWSLSNAKKPLQEKFNLENGFKGTDCGFSPRGELVFTGTSSPNSQIPGQLLFFNTENFDLVYKIDFPGVSCTRIDWHPKLNQILVGLSDGSIKILYDEKMSVRGVIGCVKRPIKRSRREEVIKEEMVLSPLALEMFQPRREDDEEKEKYLRMKDNQLRPAFRKPADVPIDGPSANGRVKDSGSTLHSYLAKQIGTQRNKEFLEDSDVRASILRHAEDAAKNPMWIDKAYKKNQPVPIFQDKTTEDEEEEGDDEEKTTEPVFKKPRTK
ncbi:hypothetical protein WR25_18714 [Diploscapter pachys]|uniref:Uncharacterized protein n=1 Tax=Diploscapter pachys TaxID=2018661 RepID=A0A2A2KFN1_9BILA|nr:hypothetical protein WR25_18714 [Diploscapter pachys]